MQRGWYKSFHSKNPAPLRQSLEGEGEIEGVVGSFFLDRYETKKAPTIVIFSEFINRLQNIYSTWGAWGGVKRDTWGIHVM